MNSSLEGIGSRSSARATRPSVAPSSRRPNEVSGRRDIAATSRRTSTSRWRARGRGPRSSTSSIHTSRRWASSSPDTAPSPCSPPSTGVSTCPACRACSRSSRTFRSSRSATVRAAGGRISTGSRRSTTDYRWKGCPTRTSQGTTSPSSAALHPRRGSPTASSSRAGPDCHFAWPQRCTTRTRSAISRRSSSRPSTTAWSSSWASSPNPRGTRCTRAPWRRSCWAPGPSLSA